jgi:hypothetical protein
MASRQGVCPSETRIMRASDLLLIGQPKPRPRKRTKPAKPAPVGPRQRMKDERLAQCLALKASIDETEDNALRCSISAQTGIVPSRQDANWEVTSPAASPVTSPARPITSSTASLEYLASSPEHRVYDPAVPMDWGEEGPIMQHAQIGHRFSFGQVAGKRAELTDEIERKRFAQNQLLAQVLAEAKEADEKVAEAEKARKKAAMERHEAHAARLAAAARGLATPPEPEPEPECEEPAAGASSAEEEVRLWRAKVEPPPRSWWPSTWVYGTDESVERVEEGPSATKKQHQRYYGKMHAGYRDVMPGLPPKTYNLVPSFMYPERERMGRLDALRELPSGLRPENDTAVQTVRVRTPNSKYANEYSTANSPAMTNRFIFRSEERPATFHDIGLMPELPLEVAPASNPVATEVKKAELEERSIREAQEPERTGDCLLRYRPPSTGMVTEGVHVSHADEAAMQGMFQVPREYASLPHRGTGPLEAAGSPRVDTTGYFPDKMKLAKTDGEPAQRAPKPASGYHLRQEGVPMVGRVSGEAWDSTEGEAGAARRERPVGRQDNKTRRQDGRAELRGSQTWLGNRQGEYSFAKAKKADAKAKDRTTGLIAAAAAAETSAVATESAAAASAAASPAAPSSPASPQQQPDVSAAVSMPSEPSVLLNAQQQQETSPAKPGGVGDGKDAKAGGSFSSSPMSVRSLGGGESPTDWKQRQKEKRDAAAIAAGRPIDKAHGSYIIRSASVPLLGRGGDPRAGRVSSFGASRSSATGSAERASGGGGKVSTPGGVVGRMAMGVVARSTQKEKEKERVQMKMSGGLSGWGDSGPLNLTGGSSASQGDLSLFGMGQADPASRWYGKTQAKDTAMGRNQTRRGVTRRSL